MDQKTISMPLVIGGVIVLAVAAFGAYALMGNNTSAPGDEMMQKEEGVMMEKDTMEGETMMETGDDMMQKDATEGETMMKKDDGTMQRGSYEAYSPEKIARAETGDVVLFFHASWCPSCRGLSADIEKNMGAIPAELSILKVDYDKETELKKKYGVTTQHTLVQVAADGTLVKKWSGSPTLSSLVSEVN